MWPFCHRDSLNCFETSHKCAPVYCASLFWFFDETISDSVVPTISLIISLGLREGNTVSPWHLLLVLFVSSTLINNLRVNVYHKESDYYFRGSE